MDVSPEARIEAVLKNNSSRHVMSVILLQIKMDA